MTYIHLVEYFVKDLAHVARLDRVRLDHAAGAAVERRGCAAAFPICSVCMTHQAVSAEEEQQPPIFGKKRKLQAVIYINLYLVYSSVY